MSNLGKVVEFVYAGSSLPQRVVFVEDVTRDGFRGYDFYRKAPRYFKNAKTSNLKEATGYKVIDLSQLPTSVGGLVIKKALLNDGFEVYETANNLMVGVKLPQNKMSVAGDTITFEGVNGKLVLNFARGLSMYENGKGINFDPSDPLPFYNSLKKVLGV